MDVLMCFFSKAPQKTYMYMYLLLVDSTQELWEIKYVSSDDSRFFKIELEQRCLIYLSN